MDFKLRLKNITDIAVKLFKYNMKIIFANKFIYFLLAALGIFLLIMSISLFSDDNPGIYTVYNLLLVPGLLLVFYPTTFGIQNDVDSRMLEIIFGVPNYRYKVWMIRMILIYIIVYLILLILGAISMAALVVFPLFELVGHLMFPIFFLGSLAFMLSTLVRNGNGTAVVMVVIGMAFLIASESIAHSQWNVFLNPFELPENMNEIIWAGIVLNNRIILMAGTIILMLWGLLNLQQRERFM